MEENDELEKKLLSHDLLKIEQVHFFSTKKKKIMIENLSSIKEKVHSEIFVDLEVFFSIIESPIIVDSIEELISNSKRKEIEKVLSEVRGERDLRKYLDKNLLRSVRIGHIFSLAFIIKESTKITIPDDINEKIRLFLFDFDGREDSFEGVRYKEALNNKDRIKIAFRARKLSVLIFDHFIKVIKNPELHNA